MAKITKSSRSGDRVTVQAKTRANSEQSAQIARWWKLDSKEARGKQVCATAALLKEQLQYRYRQASIWCRLYSNMPLFGIAGTSLQKLAYNGQLPADRPTMNVIQSCTDTLVSRLTQARPRPVFLTDNGDYKERNLGKQLNNFIAGELYQTKAYELGPLILRDAAVLGTGCIKVYKGQDKKVKLERVMATELLVDNNDSLFGNPRQLYQLQLIDREMLAEMFPGNPSVIAGAEQAYPDNAGDTQKTVADQVMVVEAWHLPSGPDATDGKHIISCTSGTLFEESWDKDSFPFVFLHYSPRIFGFWGQPLTEQLMGTQIEINKLLMTIHRSINLVGVPRVFVEDGSKVVKSHLNNEVGSIVTYRGTKPQYEVAPCVPAEVYAQLQRLVDYAYQQSGVSALSAASQKPAGLNAGVALREYDDLQSDRFAYLNKRYDNMFIDLAYQVIGQAREIAEAEGSYQTVYPNRNGTKEIDLPASKMLEDPFIIQCFDASALPRDPAGRLQKITELIQAGMIDIREGRRLLDYPDLDQNEKLANSGEERILKILDEIVDSGSYTPPDPYMDAQLCILLSNQYINLYLAANLEEAKAELLRNFNSQAQVLLQAAAQPAQPQQPQPQLAVPEPVPQTPLLPQGG